MMQRSVQSEIAGFARGFLALPGDAHTSGLAVASDASLSWDGSRR